MGWLPLIQHNRNSYCTTRSIRETRYFSSKIMAGQVLTPEKYYNKTPPMSFRHGSVRGAVPIPISSVITPNAKRLAYTPDGDLHLIWGTFITDNHTSNIDVGLAIAGSTSCLRISLPLAPTVSIIFIFSRRSNQTSVNKQSKSVTVLYGPPRPSPALVPIGEIPRRVMSNTRGGKESWPPDRLDVGRWFY